MCIRDSPGGGRGLRGGPQGRWPAGLRRPGHRGRPQSGRRDRRRPPGPVAPAPLPSRRGHLVPPSRDGHWTRGRGPAGLLGRRGGRRVAEQRRRPRPLLVHPARCEQARRPAGGRVDQWPQPGRSRLAPPHHRRGHRARARDRAGSSGRGPGRTPGVHRHQRVARLGRRPGRRPAGPCAGWRPGRCSGTPTHRLGSRPLVDGASR